MVSAIEKVIEIAANNLFDNASVQTCLTAVTDLSNNLDTRVNAVIDGAPGALNTLNELAAALNDDANYAATVTTALATKYSAGSDASFNDLSANDVSGVNLYMSNKITAHTVTAQNYAVGNTNFVSASRQGSFTELEVKNGNNATILLTGDGGDMSLEGTLTVDTINEKTGASGVTIDGVLLKDGGATFSGDVSANDGSFNVVDIHTLNLTTSLTKSDVGLGNVDNTTDVGKPVSTAQQTALDLKANLAGPTFTGNVTMSDVSANDGSFNIVDIAALKVNGVSITQNGSGGASLNINSDISINAIDAVDASFNVIRTSATMALGGHIIPTENAQYDLGNAEYKIRHLFLSDNSLWIGDDHKIDISGGKMKFKKRKSNTVPQEILDASGGSTAQDHSGAIIEKFGFYDISQVKLHHWHEYVLDTAASGVTNLLPHQLFQKTANFETDREANEAVQLPTKSGGAPTTAAAAGTMIFNTDDNKLYIYNGGWKSVQLN